MSSRRLELSRFGRMINSERERGRKAEKVTSREEKGGGDAARSITSHGDISRHFRFHSPFTSRGYETLFGGSEGGGGGGREGGEETETKTKSLRSRINFNWITVNIVSAYVEASHSSPLLLRGGCAPLRAKSRLFHLITN